MTSQTLPKPIRGQLEGLRVLIVDDESICRDVVRSFLEDQGSLVIDATNGAYAVALCLDAGSAIDVVLMDNEMPVLGGVPATIAIRSKLGASELPIIGLSSKSDVGDRDAALAAGMNDYLPKPFDSELLLAAIVRHLPRRPWPGV